jgi:hypothetical protein
MGTSAFMLTDRKKYTTEKLLSDSIVAAFNADVILNFHNSKNYSTDGHFLSTTINISHKLVKENNYSFIFYVDATDNSGLEFYYNDDVGLEADRDFFQVGLHRRDIRCSGTCF